MPKYKMKTNLMFRSQLEKEQVMEKIDYVTHSEQLTTAKKKKSKSKNQKRFNDEQIRSLETIFEFETKLEPRKKVQLARELGLQPRQIAIWFQNRRARWKSKKIEQEYKVLKANYDHLASQFEFMMKEKQSLLIEMQKLSELLENRQDRKMKEKGVERNNMGFLQEVDNKNGLSSQDLRSKMLGEQGREDLNVDSSMGSLESGGLIDQPSGNLHWWNVGLENDYFGN